MVGVAPQVVCRPSPALPRCGLRLARDADAFDCTGDGRQRRQLFAGVVHLRFADDFGEQYQRDVAVVFAVVFLADRVDGDAVFRQDAGDVRQYAGAVGDGQAQVVGAVEGVCGQYRQAAAVVYFAVAEFGEAVFAFEVEFAHDVDEVGNHRRGGRQFARAGAVVEAVADGISLHLHRVHHAVDAGNQRVLRDECRMDADFHAVVAAHGEA